MDIASHTPSLAVTGFMPPRQVPELGSISIRSHVVQALREAIFSGALQPGERLSDAQLCEEFGVSRTSIREALRYLEAEKLITILRNRRACVAKITPKQAATIYELLATLLGDAISLLSSALTPRMLRLVRVYLAELEAAHLRQAVDDIRQHLARLHELLLHICGDTVLLEIGSTLLARIGYLQNRALQSAQWRDAAVTHAREMAEALSAGSHEAARRAVHDYFQAEARIVTNVLAG